MSEPTMRVAGGSGRISGCVIVNPTTDEVQIPLEPLREELAKAAMTTPPALRLVGKLEKDGSLAEFTGLPRLGAFLELTDGTNREVVQVFSVHKATKICGVRRGVGTDSRDWPEGTQVQ